VDLAHYRDQAPGRARPGKTAHYRMAALEAAGGYQVLGRYRGPQIPWQEWEDLTRIPLPGYQQVVLDSEALYHGGFHAGTQTQYAAIVSVESGPALERWIQRQRPE
jgi:hypothetical protein